MTVLGLNAYSHDASVALLEKGRPVFAIEEERFNRERKTQAFPERGLSYLREERGLRLDDIEQIAFPWSRAGMLWMTAKLVFGQFPPALQLVTRAASPNTHVGTVLRFYRLRSELARFFGSSRRPRVRFVHHHLAHACNAYFSSPFERAAVLVMDGYGDDAASSWYRAQGGRIERGWRTGTIDSLGVLYSLVTLYLGFRTALDEGTVMALAAGGSDAFVDDFRKLVCLLPQGSYRMDRRYFRYQRYGEIRPMSARFERLFGPPRRCDEAIAQRHRDLARALQCTLEESVLHVARHLQRVTGERNLCFGGGVALNCLATTRLCREAGFERVYVPPAPSDAGQALGAALAVSRLEGGAMGRARTHEQREEISPYLGPDFDNAGMAGALRAAGLEARRVADPAETAARALARGELIGWFQGASETGPRALGHRSILGDPRDPGLRDRLNLEVKRRQPFRPFAPAVLAAHAGDWFEAPPRSPYMSFAAGVRPERRARVPAIVADDGSARLQTVSAATDPLFARLIERFRRRTGVPMLLNTSFNVQEPIVCRPADAVATFLRSGLDLLVMGRFVARRRARGDAR